MPTGGGDERIECGRERRQDRLDRLVVLQREDAHARPALAEDPVELAHQCLDALGVVRAVKQDHGLPRYDLETAGRHGRREHGRHALAIELPRREPELGEPESERCVVA